MSKLRFILILTAAALLLTGCVDEIPEPVVSKAPVVTNAPPVHEP